MSIIIPPCLAAYPSIVLFTSLLMYLSLMRIIYKQQYNIDMMEQLVGCTRIAGKVMDREKKHMREGTSTLICWIPVVVLSKGDQRSGMCIG